MDLELLRAERKKHGVTQEKLAKHLGFKNKSSYCLIEKGKTSVSVDIANQIANYLNLSEELVYKIFFASDVQETSTQPSLEIAAVESIPENKQISLFDNNPELELQILRR